MLSIACLVDAGFSGDWQARGVLSDMASDTARTACYTAAAAHVVLTGASAFIAKAKGVGIASAAATLLVRHDQQLHERPRLYDRQSTLGPRQGEHFANKTRSFFAGLTRSIVARKTRSFFLLARRDGSLLLKEASRQDGALRSL